MLRFQASTKTCRQNQNLVTNLDIIMAIFKQTYSHLYRWERHIYLNNTKRTQCYVSRLPLKHADKIKIWLQIWTKLWQFSSRPTHIYTADSDIFISTIQTVTFPPRQWLRERVTMSSCAFLWALKKKRYIKIPTNLHQHNAFTCSAVLLK